MDRLMINYIKSDIIFLIRDTNLNNSNIELSTVLFQYVSKYSEH